MKTNYLFSILILVSFANISYGQNEGEIIKLKTYCKVIKFENIIGENQDTTKFLEPYIKFIVNKIDNDKVALKALDFSKPEKAKIYNNKIYYISKTEFDKSAIVEEPKEKLTVGILTLPFKARPQDEFSFDTEFNLNTTLNWNFHKVYDAILNLQIGAGIGSVNLNESNASGITSLKAQDVATLNLFSGLMIEYKGVQAGLYIGVDQINNQSQYKWQHNGNIWFGFGIGFNVFKISLGKNDIEQ
ncbi:hypothetical protein ACIGCP_11915 [Cellulophaga baltica]|uniref:hypothetical protein n=1 Tax=Cellulophaga baltica TaxID=76594 RepID=UPI0037C738EC